MKTSCSRKFGLFSRRLLIKEADCWGVINVLKARILVRGCSRLEGVSWV